MISITRATRQAAKEGQGLMIMENVAIFNILKSTELGGLTWVIKIIAQYARCYFRCFLYGVLFDSDLNPMRGLFSPFFR